ncbi:phage tail sheath family protein [Actinoplanes sp. NPDC048796]|uniref:phage tail sheath family protein n=1 Tax=Actinoplanes sp. NPDC048796 TaxID=3155640 RepID=UPI0033DAD6F5
MPEYLAPGVYIEEIERGPKPIEGVATSTAAFLGETERGPLLPRLVTSYGEYLRLYGDIFAADRYMPYAVKTFFDNGGIRCYVTRIVGEGAQPPAVELSGLTITALGPGAAYRQVWARILPGSTRGANGEPVGFRLRLDYWANPAHVPDDAAGIDTAQPLPTWSEDFDDLSVDPASPAYFGKRINNFNSVLVEVTGDEGIPLPAEGAARLDGTEDGGAVTSASYEGSPDLRRPTGLAALDLDQFRSVAIVYAPGCDYTTAQAVVRHCERNRYRFAVVDSEPNQANAAGISPRDIVTDTKYGAFYYPWIYVSDPRSGTRKKIPPGGAVCGIYALTDTNRGVFKAPANEVVAGAIDLEYEINQATQGVLNPNGVNALRRFPGRGIRVWGARTMSSDPLWKYVSVRRLFIFLEASIYNSTQWVVFEPNDTRLWARVKQTVTLFLRTQWREGALFGVKEEEAFSVAVGPETMTEDDRRSGRLIIEIGVAPVHPAEFVVFRIFQKTQEAKS